LDGREAREGRQGVDKVKEDMVVRKQEALPEVFQSFLIPLALSNIQVFSFGIQGWELEHHMFCSLLSPFP